MSFMLVTSFFGETFALGDMEEQSGQENPPLLMSFSLGGSVNDPSNVPLDDPSHRFTTGSGNNENSPNTLSLYQWIHSQPTSHEYVKFLEESKTFDHKAPAKDIIDAVPLSVGRMHSANGVSEISSEVLYNSLANACGFKLADSSLILDAWKEKLSPVLSNNHETSTSMGFLCCGQNEVICGKNRQDPVLTEFFSVIGTKILRNSLLGLSQIYVCFGLTFVPKIEIQYAFSTGNISEPTK